jgi:hypothetical protein
MTLTPDLAAAGPSFWAKADKSEECWFWTGTLDPKGYGFFGWKQKKYRAHRFAYLLTHGEIPADLFVCHRCDCPGCVNPEHLWLGTVKENNQDSASKGRYQDTRKARGENRKKTSHRGSAHYLSPFTEAQILDIRSRDYSRWGSYTRVAEEFKTSSNTIKRIHKREVWTHI